MNLKNATKIVETTLEIKQNPDQIVYKKQWDETGRLKGWKVECEWIFPNKPNKEFSFDITSSYIRTNGYIDDIPNFIPGKHM